MEKILFVVILITQSLLTYSQSSKTMELKKLMHSESLLREFINNNFTDTTVDRKKIFEESHSLFLNEFNQVLKKPSEQYYINGEIINELYAYKKDDSIIALYLLLDMELEKIHSLTRIMGMPENIESEDELKEGIFPFLIWSFKPLQVWLLSDKTANRKHRVKTKMILTVTNVKIGSLINMEEF